MTPEYRAKMIQLNSATINAKAAMAIYVHVFTPEQWDVVTNAYRAMEQLDAELRTMSIR